MSLHHLTGRDPWQARTAEGWPITMRLLTNALYIHRISLQRSKPQTRRASLRMGIASSKILEF